MRIAEFKTKNSMEHGNWYMASGRIRGKSLLFTQLVNVLEKK
jgi:hypothetical protein